MRIEEPRAEKDHRCLALAYAMTRLQRYLKRGRRVQGWLHQYSAAFIADLSRIQREARVTGGVGEIGVHMGRLFILLKLTAAAGERTFAIDVFEDQHLNVDGSGSGDRGAFLDNVSAWTGDRSVEIIQRSSLAVRPADILDLVGACRLVSIDGGHTTECVDNDLRLTEAVLMPMGVALLDDFYNEFWPAVAAGAALYFLDPSTTLRPFAITPNKLYLAAPVAHDFYRRALCATQGRSRVKTVNMFGSAVDIFGVDVYRRDLRVRLIHAVKSRVERLLLCGKRLRVLLTGPSPTDRDTRS